MTVVVDRHSGDIAVVDQATVVVGRPHMTVRGPGDGDQCDWSSALRLGLNPCAQPSRLNMGCSDFAGATLGSPIRTTVAQHYSELHLIQPQAATLSSGLEKRV